MPLGDSGPATGGCAVEDAVEGTNAASSRRDGKTPWMLPLSKMKLFFSPLPLQTTTNNDAEHNKRNTCSLHLVAASNNNNNCYYSYLLQCCCSLAESSTLFCQATEGCRGLFNDPVRSLCALGHSMQAQEVNQNTELFPVINTGPGGDAPDAGNLCGLFSSRTAPALPFCVPTAVQTEPPLI